MGITRFARVLSTAILNGVREVKANLGSGELKNAQMLQPPGEDSNPITSDTAFLVPGVRAGEAVALGYADTRNEPTADPGGKRFYSRDAATGVLKTEIHLKPDGTIVIFADSGVTIDSDLTVTGKITAQDDIEALAGKILGNELESTTTIKNTALGVDLAVHGHNYDNNFATPTLIPVGI